MPAITPALTTAPRLGDEELMRLVIDGDPLAFAVLHRRHFRAALAVALQICARQPVAEEVVQEAFLSLWRARGLFDRRRGNVRAWLLWTVRNRAIDVLRQDAGCVAPPDEKDAQPADALHVQEGVEEQVGRRERSREMIAALGELPSEQSSVIALAYYGGYTQAEIASLLHTPIGTVKGRMRLGLRKMAETLAAA